MAVRIEKKGKGLDGVIHFAPPGARKCHGSGRAPDALVFRLSAI